MINKSQNDDTTTLSQDFIGDSIIARSDIDEYFPTWQVYNYGVPGAGIDYVRAMSVDLSASKWW